MTKLTFEDLIEIYDHTEFGPSGDDTITIANWEISERLKNIYNDDSAANDSNIKLEADPSTLAIHQSLSATVGPPRIALGLLVFDFEQLLTAKGALCEEPKAYYIKTSKIFHGLRPPAPVQVEYRAVLKVISLFIECASYLDQTKQEIVFVNDVKVTVPIRYSLSDIHNADKAYCSKLVQLFSEDSHRDQKLGILAETIFSHVRSVDASQRLVYLLANLESVFSDLSNGYRLFASSFSYSKIKSDIEAARIDFTSKIHKTFTDIQGQLLGIPLATIVVASQLKSVSDCGPLFWGNFAVVIGAWIFVILLTVSILNQWLTLKVISGEISRQKKKLKSEYSALGDEFTNVFDGLEWRACWHYAILIVIGAIAIAGAIAATIAFNRLTLPNTACLFS